MRACAILAVLFAGSALAADEKMPVREIPTKDLKFGTPKDGKPTEPATITSAEELKKSPVVGGAADEIEKKVDFSKEKLLVFAWSGSGQDILSVGLLTVEEKKTVRVQYVPGMTRDLRQHVKLVVVPKDLPVTVKP